MADQEIPVQRISFLPIMFGVLGSTENDQTERMVLLNPFTHSMVMLNGDAGVLSAVLGGDGGSGGSPPASKASIDALKTVKKEENGEGESACVVCLEGLFEREEEGLVKEMPCGHKYHGDCIEKWLRIHGSCPVCRFRMPEEQEAEEKKTDQAEREEEEGRRNGSFFVDLFFWFGFGN
ncbi:hypothetical protein LUZ60_006747 [Juncus effusus]|nr:hypothetical protein LUZ60_006747 [Juncus effusus]